MHKKKLPIKAITNFLRDKGYREAKAGTKYNEMETGTFSFHTNVPVLIAEGTDEKINIPVDVVILPYNGIVI